MKSSLMFVLVFVLALFGGAIGGLAVTLPPVRQMVLQAADQDTEAPSAQEWEEKVQMVSPSGYSLGNCQVKDTKVGSMGGATQLSVLWVVLRCPKGS